MRHGEPVGGRRYRGAQDDPLSEAGWQQMHAAVLEPELLTGVVSSPLQRCRAFAEQFAATHRLPLHCEPGFREIGFGDWEGLSPAELAIQDPEGQARFWTDPLRHTPPNAEPMVAFCDRVTSAWAALTERYRGEHLLIVGHGGLIRVLISHLLGLPLQGFNRLYVPYASLTRLRLEPGAEPTLYFHNRSAATRGER
nr:alpha-ribazole phosphatase family protein [Halorhodospira abdelmalekii]